MTTTKPYCYRHPHPAVTTDIVLFTLREDRLQLLLIKRRNPPFQGGWALPGGFVDLDEDLDACAKRELEEETGIQNIYLEQLYTFGRHDRDPRERVISVAYYALIASDKITLQSGSRLEGEMVTEPLDPECAVRGVRAHSACAFRLRRRRSQMISAVPPPTATTASSAPCTVTRISRMASRFRMNAAAFG